MNLYEINIETYGADLTSRNFTVAADNGIEAIKGVVTDIANKSLPQHIPEKAHLQIHCSFLSGSVIINQGPGLNTSTIAPDRRARRRKR